METGCHSYKVSAVQLQILVKEMLPFCYQKVAVYIFLPFPIRKERAGDETWW
jgi:hypothetical protein